MLGRMDSFRLVLPMMRAPAVRQAPLTAEKVRFAWRAACGPAIDRATSVTLGEGGILTVTAGDASWAREVHRLRHDLLRRLEPWLGAGVVTRIDVPAAATRRARRPRGATPPSAQ
jgi:predicted nucleic acid-binding Zn ribbon protein